MRVTLFLGQFRFRVEYLTDDEDTQIFLEQMLYDRNPEARMANGGYDKYRPINRRNSMRNAYMQAARAYLQDPEGG